MGIQNVGAAGHAGARHLLVSRGFVASAVLCVAVCAAGPARAADPPPGAPGTPAPAATPTYADGQKVEVREGDTWSAATILKREGRKYQVRYAGGDPSTDEWVTADRLRTPGAAAAAAPSAPATGKPAPAPAGNAAAAPGATAKPGAAPVAPASAKPAVKPPVNWPLRTAVEVKWGGTYRKATIVNRRGEWYLINYENGPFEEWVEPWRIRKVGSTDDPYGHAKPNPTVRKGQPGNPPAEQPGPPPEPPGAAARAGAGAAGAGGAGAGGDNKSIENEHTPISPTDRAGIRETVIGGGAVDALKLTPDAEAKPAKPPVQQPIVLQGSTGEFFDHNKGLYFTGPEAGLVATVHSNEPPGKPADVRVERVELSTGRSLDTARLPVSCEPLDVSPDGRLFLARSNVWGFGGSARLDLWQIGGNGAGAGGPEAKHVVSFVPFDTQQPANRDVKWAQFADADHVIAMSGNGLVALFDVRSGAAKAVWSAEAEAQATPAISANGKYLAVGIKGNEIAIIETATGRTLGRLGVDTTWGLRLSFKPDGTQLAAAIQDQLTIWDLATGKHAYDLTPVGATGSQIAWPADGFVLLDGQYLVALDKKMTVWSYEAANNQPIPHGTTYGGRYWYVASGAQAGKPALVSASLPDEPARRAAAAANPETDLLVRPGATVSLDVNVAGDIREKSLAGIRQRLKENGVTVADNAPIKLVARTELGETREIEYRAFGAGARGTSKVSATGTKYLIALQTADGKVLWERKIATSPPPMLMMKQGQSVDQAVSEAMKPSAAFFEAKIPKYVPKNKNGAGKSRLGPAGVAQ